MSHTPIVLLIVALAEKPPALAINAQLAESGCHCQAQACVNNSHRPASGPVSNPAPGVAVNTGNRPDREAWPPSPANAPRGIKALILNNFDILNPDSAHPERSRRMTGTMYKAGTHTLRYFDKLSTQDQRSFETQKSANYCGTIPRRVDSKRFQ